MSDKPFDGKTLFCVTAEIEVMVLAEDRHAAERLANDEWDEISNNISDPDFAASPAEITICGKKRWAVSADWGGSEPYGDKDGKTCQQIIEAIEEWRKSNVTAAELEAAGQEVLPGCK